MSYVIVNYERLAIVSNIVGKIISDSTGNEADKMCYLDEDLIRTMCDLHVVSFIAEHLRTLPIQQQTIEHYQLISDSAAAGILQYRIPSTTSYTQFRFFIGKSASETAASLAYDLGRIMEIATSTLKSSLEEGTSSTRGALSDVTTAISYSHVPTVMLTRTERPRIRTSTRTRPTRTRTRTKPSRTRIWTTSTSPDLQGHGQGLTFSVVSKTFMTRPRPRSRPNGQDQAFKMLLKQDQDQDLLSKTKTKTSEPKSRPRPRPRPRSRPRLN